MRPPTMETKRDQAWSPRLLQPHVGLHRGLGHEAARGSWQNPCFHPWEALSRQDIFRSACFPHLARASSEGRTPVPTLGRALSQPPGVFASW